MKWLQHVDPGPEKWSGRCIINRTKQFLDHRVAVKIHWVPGHMRAKGNEKADKEVKEAREMPGTRRCQERIASLAPIERTILERKLKEAKYWFREEIDRRLPQRRVWYHLSLESQDPDTPAIKTVALISRRYFWLKSGHAVTGTYLHLIGKTQSNRCWDFTSRARMDIHNFMQSCSASTDERRMMHEKCEKNGAGNRGQSGS